MARAIWLYVGLRSWLVAKRRGDKRNADQTEVEQVMEDARRIWQHVVRLLAAHQPDHRLAELERATKLLREEDGADPAMLKAVYGELKAQL